MRLFVAVEVPAAVRDAVAAAVAPLRADLPRLRWADPSRYHLTLVFLGSVGEASVDAVAAAVGRGAASFAPFSLALTGEVGTFGRRVLWAGLQPSSALADMAAAVQSSVASVVSLPEGERPFSAHLTLARAAGREHVRAPAVGGVGVPALSWDVDRVVLLRSAGGYEVVASFPLVGDA